MIDTQRLLNPSPKFIEEELLRVENERDYHAHPAISNSDLKLLEKSPRVFYKEKLIAEPEENPYQDIGYHMKMGTMVEQKLMEPKRFEENFIEQKDMNTPSSPNQKEFVELVLSEEYGIVEAHEKAYANSNPSKASALYEKLEDYIDFTRESKNKGTYDQDEKETLIRVCGDIMSHKDASRLLMQDAVWEASWTQLPLMAEINKVFCKGLLDRVVIDGDRALLIDLKVTSKPLNNFGYHFLRRRYYRQFAHYARLLTPFLRDKMDKAEIGCVMVAAHKEEPYGTMVKKIPTGILRHGEKELDVLLRRLRWHIEADQWERPKSYYQDTISELEFNNSDIPELRL